MQMQMKMKMKMQKVSLYYRSRAVLVVLRCTAGVLVLGWDLLLPRKNVWNASGAWINCT